MIFEDQPFVWDDKAYYDHIESVCLSIGQYLGHKRFIRREQMVHYPEGHKKAGQLRSMKGPWIVPKIGSQPHHMNQRFHTLNGAILYFFKKEKRPELV